MKQLIIVALLGFCIARGIFADGVKPEPRDVPVKAAGQDPATTCRLDSTLPEINFQENQLVDVIDFLRDVTGTNIFVNWKALERGGIAKDAKVTCKVRDVKFKQALAIILDSVATKDTKLAFYVEEGVIIVSTVADLNLATVTKTYDVRFALKAKDDEARSKQVDAMLKLITNSIDRHSWMVNDGKIGQIKELSGQLIVTQTEENQIAIKNVLEQLEVLMK